MLLKILHSKAATCFSLVVMEKVHKKGNGRHSLMSKYYKPFNFGDIGLLSPGPPLRELSFIKGMSIFQMGKIMGSQ